MGAKTMVVGSLTLKEGTSVPGLHRRCTLSSLSMARSMRTGYAYRCERLVPLWKIEANTLYLIFPWLDLVS